MTLASLIASGETLAVEFKSDVNDNELVETMLEHKGRVVLVVRVPRAIIPTGTASGRYLRRALGGDGKPACVPFFVYETAAHGLSQDPSTALVPGAT